MNAEPEALVCDDLQAEYLCLGWNDPLYVGGGEWLFGILLEILLWLGLVPLSGGMPLSY